MITVLWCPVRGPAEFREIAGTLTDLQRLVSGYLELIPLANPLGPRLVALANEDGLSLHLAPNPWAQTLLAAPLHQARQLVGDVVVLRSRGEEFVSLSDRDRTRLERLLREWGPFTPPSRTAGL